MLHRTVRPKALITALKNKADQKHTQTQKKHKTLNTQDS